MYDTLEEIEGIEEVYLANPYKTRAIADARIKTDKIDSRTLADLLRGNLIPALWIPPKDTREIKNIARYRIFLVKERVRIKNRIHNIIDRNHLEKPRVSDIFGRYGIEWLREVEMRERERKLLDKHIQMYEWISERIKEVERWIEEEVGEDEDIRLLRSIPGIGKVFAVIIKVEIGDIERFASYKKLHSYSGLVPRVYQSGKRRYYGRLVKRCNLNLRWAIIESAVSSIRVSVYFNREYRRVKERAGIQAGIISTGRKLATIVYKVLKERREYREIVEGDNRRR